MAQYIRRRLITAIPVFFGITMLVFLLVDLAPGDLTDLMGEGAASTVEQAAMEAAVGLDQPLPVRYLLWLAGLFRGDLGRSYHYGQDVSDLIVQRIGPSLLLTGTGVVLAVAIAVPLGVAAAWKPKGAWDRLAHLFTISGSAVPGFFLALVAIYLFSVRLGWLPSSGMYRSVGGGDMADLLRHLILPAGVVGVSNVGSILRQTQSACLEVLGEDYIITARAKGLRPHPRAHQHPHSYPSYHWWFGGGRADLRLARHGQPHVLRCQRAGLQRGHGGHSGQGAGRTADQFAAGCGLWSGRPEGALWGTVNVFGIACCRTGGRWSAWLFLP